MKPLQGVNSNKVAGELCRRRFFFFVKEFWEVLIPEQPVWNWHIEYLCNLGEHVVRRISKRLPKENDIIINIPPGSTKSTIWTVMLPAWAWTIDPTIRVLTTSYSYDLAVEHALKSRDIIRSDKFRALFPYVQLKKDKDRGYNYENSMQGQRLAAGLSGTITGIHAHLIINDDPINPKQAASEVECRNTNALLDSTLSTRKIDKELTVTATIMQRLSENDCTAHLLSKKEKRIQHICLPAEARDGVKPAILEEKYVRGLLDPIRLNEEVLREALIDLGAAGYAGQYGQRPAPARGLIWQKWFIEVPDDKFPDKKFMAQYGTDWDTAYTKDDDNAASAYVTAGKIGHKIYIDDFGWEWLEFPQLIKYMKTKPSPHYIEAKASGKSSKQTLVQNGVIAIEVAVAGGDKIARANMATPIAEAGMVYIRQSMAERLYTDSKQGILNFPRGKFKDLADVLAQSLQRLSKKSSVSITAGDEDDDY